MQGKKGLFETGLLKRRKGNVLEGLLRARGRATSSPGLTGKALGMRLESKEGALKR